MKSYDVLIVGAGIVGCACAFECAQAGLRVGLIERSVTGGGATAAGMGHIVVMDDSPAQLDLTRYSRSLWQQLVPKLPDAVEYETRGTLWVAANEEEMAEVHSKRSTYAAVGVHADVLNQAEVAAEEPKLRPGLAGGLLVPDDGSHLPSRCRRMASRSGRDVGRDRIAGHRGLRRRRRAAIGRRNVFSAATESCSRPERTAPCCPRCQ